MTGGVGPILPRGKKDSEGFVMSFPIQWQWWWTTGGVGFVMSTAESTSKYGRGGSGNPQGTHASLLHITSAPTSDDSWLFHATPSTVSSVPRTSLHPKRWGMEKILPRLAG